MEIREVGLNYRMTDFQAALGLAQIDTVDEQIEHRRQTAENYNRELSSVSGIKTPCNFTERRHVYQTYHIVLDSNVDRDTLIRDLRVQGIEVNFGAWALNCLTLYRDKFGYTETDFPNAVRAFRSGLALPMGSHISSSEVRTIAKALAECLAHQLMSV